MKLLYNRLFTDIFGEYFFVLSANTGKTYRPNYGLKFFKDRANLKKSQAIYTLWRIGSKKYAVVFKWVKSEG